MINRTIADANDKRQLARMLRMHPPRRFFLRSRNGVIVRIDVDRNILAPMFFFQCVPHLLINRARQEADACALFFARQVLQCDCFHKIPRFSNPKLHHSIPISPSLRSPSPAPATPPRVCRPRSTPRESSLAIRCREFWQARGSRRSRLSCR